MSIAHGYDNDHAISPEGVESHPYVGSWTYQFIIQPLQGCVFILFFPMGFTHGY
ncbi:MAG: hypothetical protein ABSD71_14740 [Bacteroidales bacterium]|jgi:hypothetical protein